jgi:hypothetical protein
MQGKRYARGFDDCAEKPEPPAPHRKRAPTLGSRMSSNADRREKCSCV